MSASLPDPTPPPVPNPSWSERGKVARNAPPPVPGPSNMTHRYTVTVEIGNDTAKRIARVLAQENAHNWDVMNEPTRTILVEACLATAWTVLEALASDRGQR